MEEEIKGCEGFKTGVLIEVPVPVGGGSATSRLLEEATGSAPCDFDGVVSEIMTQLYEKAKRKPDPYFH